MNKAFAIISDIHAHNWSQFSGVDEQGRNTRLVALLSEVKRASETLRSAGGDTMFVAGDLFHVRGSLPPSVLNPVMDCFRELSLEGTKIWVIPGNHDLEGRNSERLGSAVTALEGVDCKVFNKLDCFAGVWAMPWMDSIADLKDRLSKLAETRRAIGVKFGTDVIGKESLIIHAPVNGVIMGIPDHGLDAGWLAGLGFRRVFAGHFHNHVEFPGGVYSIGAIAHHTWSDVGSKAGFLIVHENKVDFHPSILPAFVDVFQDTPAASVPAMVKGNYARVKVSTSKLADIEKMREYLTKQGALGTVIMSVKAPTEERTGGVTASVSAGASIEQSISEFVKSKGFEPDMTKEIEMAALRVLAEAEVA